MVHGQERFDGAIPLLRKARLLAVYGFARLMGVPVRVRDEFWLRASGLQPFVRGFGDASRSPIEIGHKL